MTDIRNKADIMIFVDEFYKRARADKQLGMVFESRVADDEWPKHLQRMYAFWNTVLFGKADYKGNPFSKHADLPISDVHFDHWVNTLSSVIDENFEGPKADEVKWRAEKMGKLFSAKLQMLRDNKSYKNIM